MPQRAQQPLALTVRQRRQQHVEHRLRTRAEGHGPYGVGQLPQGTFPLAAGRDPAGQLRAGGVQVVVLGQHPQQAGRRRLGQFTDQRCVPAGRQQPLPYGPGTELGETDELDRPGGQLLSPGIGTLPRRRVRRRPRDAQQLPEFRRHVREQLGTGIGEVDVEEHRIGHPTVTLDRAQVVQQAEHRAQVPVGVLEPHPVLGVRPGIEREGTPIDQVYRVAQPRPGHRGRQAVERVQHVVQDVLVDVEEHRLDVPAAACPDQGLPQLEARVEGAQPQLERVGQHRPGLGHRVQPPLDHPDQPRLLRPPHQQSQPRQVGRRAHAVGLVAGAEYVHQLAGLRHPQPSRRRHRAATLPRPFGESAQLRHGRRRLGPPAQFVGRGKHHGQLRLGPGHAGQRAAGQPPFHDRGESPLIVGGLPALRPVHEALKRRPVLYVHALLRGRHRPELRQSPASAVRHRGQMLFRDPVDRGKGLLE
ncbi:hypothetical protein ABZ137_33215 [Streptomyces bobili]|uniref:hypothetical protein n=1 Tax=Streptomyces bobili TaxID=67280 RepID=UPI0033ACA699